MASVPFALCIQGPDTRSVSLMSNCLAAFYPAIKASFLLMIKVWLASSEGMLLLQAFKLRMLKKSPCLLAQLVTHASGRATGRCCMLSAES